MRRGFVDDCDLDAILERHPEAYSDAARFAYATGWRRGGVLGLVWTGVDRRAGTVTLFDSKNGRGRVLPVVPELAEILDRREAARTCGYVFADGGAYLWRFSRLWREATVAAGRPGVLFHDLRRSAVRNMIRGGAHEAVVRGITGRRACCLGTTSSTPRTPRGRLCFRRSIGLDLAQFWHSRIPKKNGALKKSAVLRLLVAGAGFEPATFGL